VENGGEEESDGGGNCLVRSVPPGSRLRGWGGAQGQSREEQQATEEQRTTAQSLVRTLGRGSWRFALYYLVVVLIAATGGHVSGIQWYGPLLLIALALTPVAVLWLVAVGIDRMMEAARDRYIRECGASAAESEAAQESSPTGTPPLPPDTVNY
jgi:hypothetical protein